MFIKIGKVLKRYRDSTCLIYTQMIETQCICYICNATAMRNRSSVGYRAVLTFSQFDTGSSPTQVFQVATIAFMFKIYFFCQSFLFTMILLNKKYIMQKE